MTTAQPKPILEPAYRLSIICIEASSNARRAADQKPDH